MTKKIIFEDLPITFFESETRKGGWTRRISREGKMEELLEIWDIEDDDTISQLMRHIQRLVSEVNRLNNAY